VVVNIVLGSLQSLNSLLTGQLTLTLIVLNVTSPENVQSLLTIGVCVGVTVGVGVGVTGTSSRTASTDTE